MKKILCMLLICINSHALIINRVILSTDTNPDYIEFWPVVAKAWKEIIGVTPTLALIAHDDVYIDQSLGDVIRFEPIEGIPTSFQAQVIRLLLPALFEDDACVISDIDMIPLNKEYFVDSVKPYPNDNFIVYRDNAYHPNENKFPMCYVAAQGKTFKELFGIVDMTSIRMLIKELYALNLDWNTDELVLYKYLLNWSEYNTRCRLLGHAVERRIDRSHWAYDPNLLTLKYYIDAHCPRPYNTYQHSIDAIVTSAIDVKKRYLENADYGTHMAPLITAVMHTDGPVLEMGSGDYSTPLLHALCSKNKRFLCTTDTDKKWLDNFIDLKNEWHEFRYIPVYEDDWSLNPKPTLWDNVGNDVHWSVVLVDHRPGERRVEDIKRLRGSVDIFVVHDTQQPSYEYEPVLNTFKYKYVYKRYTTLTTLVSDTIDIRTLFED